MFYLTFVCEIFEFFGKTTSENFITFEINCRGMFITPSSFNKGFNFASIVTNIFFVLFGESKGIALCVKCMFLRVKLFFENLEKRGPIVFVLLGESVIPL